MFRLLAGDVAVAFFHGLVEQARRHQLLSTDHFTVDGTLRRSLHAARVGSRANGSGAVRRRASQHPVGHADRGRAVRGLEVRDPPPPSSSFGCSQSWICWKNSPAPRDLAPARIQYSAVGAIYSARAPVHSGECGETRSTLQTTTPARDASGLSPLKQDSLPGGASRLAALLIAHLCPISSLFAPCHAGAALRDLGNESLIRDTRISRHRASLPPRTEGLRSRCALFC